MIEKDREHIIKTLKSLKESYLYYGDSNGYGSWGTIRLISSFGVHGPVSFSNSPIEIEQDEYNEALKLIQDKRTDLIDEETLEMINAGCKPNIQYYRDEFTNEYIEWERIFKEIIEYDCIEEWDDMDTEILREFYNFIISKTNNGQ